MSFITIIVLIFAFASAVDYIIGNKFGIGKEFEKAFSLFCPLALSMLGMIVIAPAIGVWLTPIFEWFYNLFGIDPSVIPASLLANDMGGAPLAQSICKTEQIGNYNAFIIASMMGCVISFTIPFSLGVVKKHQRREMFFGFLCGIVTIPVGSIVAGLICKINLIVLLINLIPLIILSVIVVIALIFVPDVCIKCFSTFGFFMKTLSIVGLLLAVFTFLTKITISTHFDTFENAAFICANACVTLAGMLPLMFVVSKILNKPLNKLGLKLSVDSVSAIAFLGTTITNATTFGSMEKMNKKGVVLNSAFAVSASFALGDHLAFTMAFDSSYILPMIVGKIVSGICAIILALIIYKE